MVENILPKRCRLTIEKVGKEDNNNWIFPKKKKNKQESGVVGQNSYIRKIKLSKERI